MVSRIAAALIVLVGVSGGAYAQSGPPLDRNGLPYITSGPQPSPGDYTQERPGAQPANTQSEVARPDGRHREPAFRD